jgi:hypothetical protein
LVIISVVFLYVAYGLGRTGLLRTLAGLALLLVPVKHQNHDDEDH